MFACFYSLTLPVAALVSMAETFTPRLEVVGPLVMLDVSGVTRLFGSPREMGEQMRRASTGPVRIAIAPSQTAAALIALSRPGLVVIDADGLRDVLAQLPISVLGQFERLRLSAFADDANRSSDVRHVTAGLRGASGSPIPHVAEMEDVLPYFQHSLRRTSDAAAAPHRAVRVGTPAALSSSVADTASVPHSGGWTHPRDAHAAANTRRPRRAVTAARTLEHPHAVSRGAHAAALGARQSKRNRTQELAVETVLETLRRWGVKTFAQLAALPPGDVYERLGARGVLWQRLARGEDTTPLVPWVPEDPFEVSLDLDWPIEGLEPLSFVLGRLLEPLAERLERADRGAAILHVHLRLVDKTVHARMVQLPSPMRDPKTLRTLMLLDLESNPPSAAIDRVRVLIEPTPARVTQWALFERAQPSPEQVSTLLARLTALMGESHVGSPRCVDSWKPGAFEMGAFTSEPHDAVSPPPHSDASATPGAVDVPGARVEGPRTALRRFRLPVPARVQVQDGRPIRITTDRRGVSGGMVIQSAGPWRTSGEWWNDGPAGRSWDRDEWDVALSDGTVYRIYVERDVGQWFLEGVVD
jgi:protein ImuB